MSQLLQRSSREELVLELLKGYQTFTQACGILQLQDPRDAFLANLCKFALTCNGVAPPGQSGPGLRTRTAAADELSSPRDGRAVVVEPVEAGLVLAPKNIQSMRTLFNIAHRLSNVLGSSWGLVLETLNQLNAIT